MWIVELRSQNKRRLLRYGSLVERRRRKDMRWTYAVAAAHCDTMIEASELAKTRFKELEGATVHIIKGDY